MLVAPPVPRPSGERILARATSHIGETYVLGARAPMANATWRGPWDCAEFVSWCVYQDSGILYGTEPRSDPVRADAYTGFWAEQAETRGIIVTIAQAARIPGACVLRKPGASGIGHIALSDGRGGTVEAHSSARGVTRDVITNRRWDYGVLVPGIEYLQDEQAVPIEPPAMEVLRVTEPLTRGKTILAVQRALVGRGYFPGTPDGIYGPQTASAVQQFQADQGLVVDGEVGPMTLAALGVELNRSDRASARRIRGR